MNEKSSTEKAVRRSRGRSRRMRRKSCCGDSRLSRADDNQAKGTGSAEGNDAVGSAQRNRARRGMMRFTAAQKGTQRAEQNDRVGSAPVKEGRSKTATSLLCLRNQYTGIPVFLSRGSAHFFRPHNVKFAPQILCTLPRKQFHPRRKRWKVIGNSEEVRSVVCLRHGLELSAAARGAGAR